MRLVGAPERRLDRPALPASGHRAMGALFVGLGALLVGYVVWLWVEPHYSYSPVVNGWAVDAFEVLVAALCMARALRSGPGRGAAVALGVGLLSWACGDIFYTTQTLAKATTWGPTWADAFWLGFYPPAYVGVVLFMRREVRKIADPSWLDGAVAGLGASAVCAAFAFSGVDLKDLTGGSVLSATTYLAYPIGDLLLFALVVGGAALLSGRKSAPWVLLASAMALNALGDTFNLFQSSLGTPRSDAVFRALAWPAAGLLISVALWLRPRPSDLLATHRAAGFALPATAATAASGVLVVGTFHHVAPVALALAAVTMGAVGVRLIRSARQLRSITEERLDQSLTDALTGLRNRRYLLDVLDAFFAEQADGRATSRRLALLYIDLDRFKAVNDSFGHAAGDELLRQLGPRLTTSLRHGEALVRLGGDEFGVVLIGEGLDAVAVARRLIAEIEKPFDLQGLKAQVGASIGVAEAPGDASDGESLLHCADIAMYRAKQEGSAFAQFDRDVDADGDPRRLSDELRLAIEQGQLILHYQPQLDLRRNVFPATEALVRWQHPRFGTVPPNKFIPLAEDAGLMPALTSWVLAAGLDQCAAWRGDGSRVTVSINISPTDLLAAGFVSRIRHVLAERDLPPDALVLEVTETTIIANLDAAKQVVTQLRDLGVVVSIDDFGAGATSLAYLSDLEVGELKLDGTFTARLSSADNARDLDLVRATIELGHALDMRVVAECIEDQATLDMLRELGCDVGQGYLISRPMPPDRLSFPAANVAMAPAAWTA